VSDLSRLLDDVYGDTALAPAPSPDAAPADVASSTPLAGLPDWAVDSVLDEAFADWVPGPPTPLAEVGSDHDTYRVSSVPRSAFTDLADGPTASATEPDAPHAWIREDDDILPTNRRGGRRNRGGRTPIAAPPPTPIEAFAAPDEPAPSEAKPSRFRRRKG